MSVPCGELVPINAKNRPFARLNKLLLVEDKPSWNVYRMVVALTVANACLGKILSKGSWQSCFLLSDLKNVQQF